MQKFYDEEFNAFSKRLFRNVDFKGGSAPQVDYGAIRRQQEQERQRLQGIRDEQFRVEGIADYIDYMYDNPETERMRSATGSFFNAISPGKTPSHQLYGYQSDKSITLKGIKADTAKYFKNRSAVPTLKEGKIKLGKRTDKPVDTSGLLVTAGTEKKQLLGA